MTSNLSSVNLGSIATFRAGYAFPKKDQGNGDGEVPFIKVSDFNIPGNEIRILIANNYVSEEYVKERKLKTFPAGTIVFAKIGVALLSDRIRILTQPTLIDNNLMGCIARRVNEKYLSCVLEQTHLSRYADGSALPFLKQSTIEQVSVDVFSDAIQNRIGNFMNSLDMKIEVNNRIISNLEKQLTCLFDKKCTTNEQQGFDNMSLSDIATFTNGLAMQKFPPESEDEFLDVLKIRELRQGCLDENSDKCSVNIDERFKVKDADIIFSWSGSLMVDIWTGGLCGLNQHLFKVTSNNYPKWFVYLWVKHHVADFAAIAAEKATTMGHIKRSDIDKAKVVVPNKDAMGTLNKLFAPMYELLVQIKMQNKKLSKIRVFLLPKLLSGEVKLNN